MYGYNPNTQMQAAQFAQGMRGDPYGGQYMPPQRMQLPSPQMVSPCDMDGARNAQIPMDGTPTYFANPQAGEIYVKRLSMVDGSMIFEVYRREPSAPAPKQITVEQYADLIKRIEALEGKTDAK